jgi:hypothetical protein
MQMAGTRRTKDGLLIALGAALMLIVLLVLQSFVGGGLFSMRTVTVSTADAYEQVANAYADHLTQMTARNIPALVSGYESNATVEWTGGVGGLTGKYSGSTDIGILLTSFFGKLYNSSLSNEYQSIGVKGDVSVVNATFDFQGNSTVVGKVNGTVISRDVYEHAHGSSWLISRETWNFTRFNEQLHIST